MYIADIELHLAKRLLVRGIKNFKATFSSLYQIILGTNGSGKSYLLSELSPLPGIAKMFEKGGYKKITIHDDGHIFVLTNKFDSGSGVHSFVMDGVDLNENGTGTIQKELVAKYFKGLTPELFSVLTYRKFSRFTEMDTNKRRSYMMMLSGIDLDWAMNVYQALRTRSRDASGHVKRINQKLSAEIQVAIDDSDIEKMETRLKMMQADFTEALRLTKNGIPTLNDIERLLTPKLMQLDGLNSDLSKFMSSIEGGICTFGIGNKEGIDRYITTIKANIETLDITLSKTYEDKARVDGELEKLKEMGAEGLAEYKSVIDSLSHELSLTDVAIAQFGFSDITSEDIILGMHANLDTLVKQTTTVLSNLFDNSTRVITLERTNEMRNKECHLLSQIPELKRKIEIIEHRMQHSKDTTNVECPSCNFIFKPGISGSFDIEAPKALARFNEELIEVETSLKEVHEYLSKVQEQVSGLARFDQVATMFGGYKDLWEKLGDFGIETNNPKLALSILNDYVEWVKLLKHRLSINTSHASKLNVYQQALELDSKDMELTRKHAQELNDSIEDTLSKMAELRTKQKELSVLASIVSQIDEGLRVCDLLINEIDLILEQEEEAEANVLLEDILRTLQGEIEALEQQVSTIRVQRAIIEDLKNTVVQAKFDQDLYKLMADEISPTDGLIADVLRKFIESFTDNQSNIINTIWSYPLYVLPCISSKDGLDYKFPIRVYGSNLPIPDISEGSDAQVDIVDLSFVWLMMNLLGMDNFPLYLDEPISRMDELHRIETIRIIQSMVESNQCSQMFFISHFAAQHGSFPESETIVMDSSNIVNLPTIYNKHCTIK